MNESLIIDLFRYFSKFPQLEGVKKLFRNTRSNLENYSLLKDQMDTMPVHSLIPELKDYLFGVNANIIKYYVENYPGLFLWVEYGNVLKEKNKYSNLSNSISIAFTVAKCFSRENKDFIEEMIISDKSLQIVQAMLQIIESENKRTCNFIDLLTFPMQILPVEPHIFHGCVGWTVISRKVILE